MSDRPANTLIHSEQDPIKSSGFDGNMVQLMTKGSQKMKARLAGDLLPLYERPIKMYLILCALKLLYFTHLIRQETKWLWGKMAKLKETVFISHMSVTNENNMGGFLASNYSLQQCILGKQ